MSYNNAEPTPLKFLVSNGDLVDESGNVIGHSDSLKDMYEKASPQVKKFLLSDGSVVDENNNLIIKNEYFKKVYEQATPKVAKYLHADGTVDENPGSGGGGTNKMYAWYSPLGRYGYTVLEHPDAGDTILIPDTDRVEGHAIDGVASDGRLIRGSEKFKRMEEMDIDM